MRKLITADIVSTHATEAGAVATSNAPEVAAVLTASQRENGQRLQFPTCLLSQLQTTHNTYDVIITT